MRAPLVILLGVGLGCGARTGLALDASPRESDGGVPETCVPAMPERFGEVDATPRAVDGRSLWVTYGGPDFLVGVVDTESGAVERVAERQFAVWGFAARGGQAWWSNSGFSDFDGQIVTASAARRRPRVLEDRLFQPGGVQHDGRFVFYAEWTNSGSLRDERRGRIVRMAPDGSGARDLAGELGLPAATAVAHEHVYWVDRRRDHVARVHRDGGEVEVVAAGVAIRGELAARGEAVVLATREDGRDRVSFFEADRSVRMLADVDGEVRGLAPSAHGVLIEVFDETGHTSLLFRPWGRDEVVTIDPDGASPLADERRVYWRRAGEDPGLIRVCLPWLSTR